MTAQEVNKRIALLEGWITERYSPFHDDVLWLNPVLNDEDVCKRSTAPPDFCGKWEHAGPLLEEMIFELGWYAACGLVWTQITIMCAKCWADDEHSEGDIRPREAISRAYLAWKGGDNA